MRMKSNAGATLLDAAASPATPATIEQLGTIAQMHEVERLQSSIWRSDPSWVVPSHLLYIVADYGGIVLGARVADQLVGFVLGLLGRTNGRDIHASHMLGIVPEFQGRGIGAALKNRQREVALSQGLNLMAWTFDPLESRNAHFNLHKLGASCRAYRPDYYGEMRDEVNQGLPSDRLIVEWELDATNRPRPSVTPEPLLTEISSTIAANLTPLSHAAAVSIPVPRDIHQLRKTDPDRALRWRLQVRVAFMSAIECGFVVRDFRDGAHVLYAPEAGGR